MVTLIVLVILLVAQNLKSHGHGSGFDAYSSCYRKSRQRPTLPCDFMKQSWCAIPGSSYPWHAVRRFVHENQGLMRRMYGDERHISVLKAELESNEIEYFHDAKDEARHRYTKQMSATLLRSNGRKSAKVEKTKKAISHSDKNENNINKIGFKIESKKIFNDLSKSTPLLTLKPQTTLEAKLTSTAKPNNNTPVTITTTVTTATVASISDSPSPVTDTPASTLQSQIEFSEPILNDVNTTVSSNEQPSETTEPYTTTDGEVIYTTEGQESEKSDEVENEEEEEEEVYEDSVEEADETEPVSQKPPPILRLKGINACPVKEEVVAPFWANNTRGEVLALLNLYPFEQYVHWEKCSYENKQMFCRDGCRCEQQYRLHRLLAYDPNNECRGIFSDWFRFPSCCICKCYDVPMEFRLTSRSPRSPTIDDMQPGPT